MMNIRVGAAAIEESGQYASHSRLKPSQISFEGHWWEAAILPNHLIVAKHTHGSRHGTVKH